ncbi:hypothetical protein DRN86_01555 [Candidatus Geothermarchaeota archaeon]|nr:MAG: hypothetical protein DRN86_01555 [Candidatus Geothermarchaeota archaeon]
MEAVILAAGKGKRIKLFCRKKPKPLIRIVDRPILDYIIEALIANGINRIVFVLGHMRKALIDFIKVKSKDVGFKFDICVQKNLLGTGHALKTARFKVKSEKFLVIYGDLYFDPVVIKNLLIASDKGKFDSYVVLTKKRDVEQYGLVEVNRNSVKKIVEKPKEKRTGLINTGIYLFSRKVFDELDKVSLSERGEYELTDALSLMASKGLVGFVKIPSNKWIDIGRPWDILDACRLELKRRPYKFINKAGFRAIPPVHIDPTAKIGDGCLVGPYACVEERVRIGGGCIIRNTIVMRESVIGEGSKLLYSIIGERCTLGSHVSTKIKLEKPIKIKIEEREIVVEKRKIGAFIGDCSIIPDFKELSPAQMIFGSS